MQIFGSLIGIGITYLSSKHNDPGVNKITPNVPFLCPQLSGATKVNQCRTGSVIQQVLKYEIIGSALFVFTWLVIRRFPLRSKIANFVKPLLISYAYFVMLMFTRQNSTGYLNSTLAFEVWIWGMGAYSDL